MRMAVYATNNPAAGYQLNGNLDSIHEAQAWAESRGAQFAHWWDDEDGSDRPAWVGIGPAGAEEAGAA